MQQQFWKISTFVYFLIVVFSSPAQPIYGQDNGDSLTISFQSNSGDVQGTVIADPQFFESGTQVENGTRYLLPIRNMVFTKDGQPFPVLIGGVTISDRNGVETLSISASGFQGANIGMRATLTGGNFFQGENLPDAESLANFFNLANIQIICGPETLLGTASVKGENSLSGVTFSSNPVVHQVMVPFKVFEVVSGQNETEQDLTLDFEVGDEQFKFHTLAEDGSIGSEIQELGIPAGEFFQFASSFQPNPLESDQSLELNVEVKVKEDDSITLDIVGVNVFASANEDPDLELLAQQVLIAPISVAGNINEEVSLGVELDFSIFSNSQESIFYSLKVPDSVSVKIPENSVNPECDKEHFYENLIYHSDSIPPDHEDAARLDFCHFFSDQAPQPLLTVEMGSSPTEHSIELNLSRYDGNGDWVRLEPITRTVKLAPIVDGEIRNAVFFEPVNVSVAREDTIEISLANPDFNVVPFDANFEEDRFGIVCNSPDVQFFEIVDNRLSIREADESAQVSLDFIPNAQNGKVPFPGPQPNKINKNGGMKNKVTENGLPYRAFVYNIDPSESYLLRFSNNTENDLDFTFMFFVAEPRSGARFLPGDCNSDSLLDLTDAICMLSHLFLGNPDRLPCGDGDLEDPANIGMFDSNGQAGIDTSDAIYLLVHLFVGGPGPVQGNECVAASSCPNSCGQ